jgi:hypothetical protein
MADFKVICKISGDWIFWPVGTKVITTSKLFGLIKKTSVVEDKKFTTGPNKEEICIVYDTYEAHNEIYYKLKGYPNGGYCSKYFIRLDEFTETQKEIAQKSEPILN